MSGDSVTFLQSALDLLVRLTLLASPMHGHGIRQAIQRSSEEMVKVEHGSLYAALHRLEKRGWGSFEWKATATGRPMKFDVFTAERRTQLQVEQTRWEQFTTAIGLVLRQA